jgi:hypothetical protein
MRAAPHVEGHLAPQLRYSRDDSDHQWTNPRGYGTLRDMSAPGACLGAYRAPLQGQSTRQWPDLGEDYGAFHRGVDRL